MLMPSPTSRLHRRYGLDCFCSPLGSAWTHVHQVPELWDDAGDTLVFLAPETSEREASFKIQSSLYASSPMLTSLARAVGSRSDNRQVSLESATDYLHIRASDSSAPSPTTASPSPIEDDAGSAGTRGIIEPETVAQEFHLHFPVSNKAHQRPVTSSGPTSQVSSDDLDDLVSVRNLFAFLMGQPLVASNKASSAFQIFLRISDYLAHLQFSNLDESTYGEVAVESFQRYIETLKLADVRSSRERTIEALILGERMRSVELYNEAFVHAVGRYDALTELKSARFDMISAGTRERLERSHMDLRSRVSGVNGRLTEFEFPSLFAGIASSTTSEESKIVHFGAWKNSFAAMRRHTLDYYKRQFGSWPPKANKKTGFEEGGLNRVVLRLLYQDMSDLYDLLVDRTAITTRGGPDPDEHDGGAPDPNRPATKALRRVMSEFDKSSPPVQPGMPYDTPRLPGRARAHTAAVPASIRDDHERTRKRKEPELAALLSESYNADADKATAFLDGFKAFERKAAQGKSLNELCDQRDGYWIFLYAVLQALPLVVVDAPGLRWTEGVEYFLCEPPKGGLPWVRRPSRVKTSWYGVAGGTTLVNLPADVVDHGVEGIYRRSHCWTAAERWAAPNFPDIGTVAGFAPENNVVGGDVPLFPPAPPPFYSGPAPPPSQDTLGWPVMNSPVSSLSSPTTTAAASAAAATAATAASGARWERNSHRNSVVIGSGLEALPLPEGVVPSTEATSSSSSSSRPGSHLDPNKTFADIIPDHATPRNKKKWSFP